MIYWPSCSIKAVSSKQTLNYRHETGNGRREGGWPLFDFFTEIKTVFNDYLETLGIRRPEKRDVFLSKTREWNRELDKRLKKNLGEFRMTASAA